MNLPWKIALPENLAKFTEKKLRLISVTLRSFSGPYFPVFGLNTGKYGPEKTLYLDIFRTVYASHTVRNSIPFLVFYKAAF